MSHLVAYIGNEPEHLVCALISARAALSLPAGNRSSGWGLGFVQGLEVLLQKRPRAEGTSVDFFTLTRDLKADAFIARGGLADELPIAAEDSDPFRFRGWLMGTVGNPEGWNLVREQILAGVPDFLRRNIRGRSPGELFFHLFLSFLHDAGVLESHMIDAAPIGKALIEANAFVDRLLATAGAPASQMALVATNGRCLVARSAGFAMQYLRTEGIQDCTVCRQRLGLHSDVDGRRYAHEALRATVIEADPDSPRRPGWILVSPGTTLLVDAGRVTQLI